MLAKIIVFVAALIFSQICIHIIICGRKKNDIFKKRKTKQIQGIYYHGLLTYLKSKARRRPKGGTSPFEFSGSVSICRILFGKAFWKKN